MLKKLISLDEVLEIHKQQIALYGGTSGIRDSAAARVVPKGSQKTTTLNRQIPRNIERRCQASRNHNFSSHRHF